ncbi:unnamed protein product [marine sediment metagenome]|uniref:Uncharacterized protein n=1 Tax=marine sediment metagenome TaxID=412755 RepID=X0U8Z2_9ZZZZ
MPGKDGDKQEYTIKDIEHDMKIFSKLLKTVATNNQDINKRLEAVEAMSGGEEDEDFSSGDRKKALSRLADNVINPDDNMLPQMTETPDRMLMPMIIKHAQNEFLKEKLDHPDSKVLFSDLLMKWCDKKMRARNRALIGEAMGFSQIEVDKAMDAEARGLESQGEP